ncbi:hypothetical protein JHU04_002464 [Brenneria sp. 4F2]|nr:hypothetical protein [Brenneria bubanii]
MKNDWLDSELNKLTDDQRKYVDESAMEIMNNDAIRHRVEDALRKTLRLDSDFEGNRLMHSDEYTELSNDFITDAAYIAAVHRIKQAIKNNQDDVALSELENMGGV